MWLIDIYWNPSARMSDASKFEFLLPLKDIKGICSSLTLSEWNHCASLMITKYLVRSFE